LSLVEQEKSGVSFTGEYLEIANFSVCIAVAISSYVKPVSLRAILSISPILFLSLSAIFKNACLKSLLFSCIDNG